MRTRTCRAPMGGARFGDEIETDRLEFGWDRRLEGRVISARLRLPAQ
jgi:hypothetical protein